jgi:hypothetical protein
MSKKGQASPNDEFSVFYGERLAWCNEHFEIFISWNIKSQSYIGGQPLCEPSRTVRTGPNLNSTQNGDPKDTYLQCEGRNKHDEVMYIPKRFCKSLLKSRDMTVCIWHKSVRTLPKMVRTRFEQTRFGLHLVCKCCEAMFRCCNIICELGAFLFA